jgi:hypothetical protein
LKTFSIKYDPLTGEEYFEVYLRGQQILSDPLLNKASCFSEEERFALEPDGLLRPGVSSIPTSKCECTAEDVVKSTKGKGLMASGSSFYAN